MKCWFWIPFLLSTICPSRHYYEVPKIKNTNLSKDSIQFCISHFSRYKYWASTPFSVKVNYKFESLPVTMINYNTLIFWWIAFTTKYYFLIATIVKLQTRLGNKLLLVIFQISWHLKFDSLYSSLAIYHLSCSSFVFLGIVIVKVCFFPGADFLLNKALVKKMSTISRRQKHRNKMETT